MNIIGDLVKDKKLSVFTETPNSGVSWIEKFSNYLEKETNPNIYYFSTNRIIHSFPIDVLERKGLRETKDSPFNKLNSRFEKDIFGGKIKIRSNKFYFIGDGIDFEIPISQISQSSSILSNLAIIFVYFKYIINPKDTVIIQNIESGLHPEQQVKLIELIVEYANKGVKVILTTHSSFVFNKLSNLVGKKKIKEEDVLVCIFGKIPDIEIIKFEKKHIRYHSSFGKVAMDLHNERIDIFEMENNNE